MSKFLDNFGPDVEMTSKSLGTNKGLTTMLEDMGKTLKPAEATYKGSFCTHIYVVDNVKKEIAFAHHHTQIDVAETTVSAAVADLAVHLMKQLFGRNKPATRDSRDKR